MQTHPDRPLGGTEEFKQVIKAYRQLQALIDGRICCCSFPPPGQRAREINWYDSNNGGLTEECRVSPEQTTEKINGTTDATASKQSQDNVHEEVQQHQSRAKVKQPTVWDRLYSDAKKRNDRGYSQVKVSSVSSAPAQRKLSLSQQQAMSNRLSKPQNVTPKKGSGDGENLIYFNQQSYRFHSNPHRTMRHMQQV